MLPPWPGQVLTPLLAGRVTSVQPAVVVENDEDYLGLRLRTVVTDRPTDGVSGAAVWGVVRHAGGPGATAKSLVAAGSTPACGATCKRCAAGRLVLTDNRLPRRLSHA